MKDKLVVGIDLGTTFSAIAYVDEYGKPTIIPNSDNERITPSVVLFEEDEIIVGKIAKANALSDPEHVIQYIKREMGNKEWEREIYGKVYTPEKISALILKRIVEDAKEQMNKDIEEAVITVPAYFGDLERKATQDAGEIAGLKVLGILNEPTAAAIAYSLNKLNKDQKVLVYDLGGGTFDVTILSIKNKHIEVLATDGEVQLGGKDWDDVIINYVAEEFIKEYNIDPRDDLDAYQSLRDISELAKISLSKKTRTKIVCQCQGKTLKLELTREKFEELSKPLLEQTESYIPIVLEKAKVEKEEIDTILLVGGSTRMPQVREMIKRYFGKEPNISINPDECVALGAALYATILKLKNNKDSVKLNYIPDEVEEALTGLKITNVTAHSLGIIVKDKDDEYYNHILIPQQTQLPYEITEEFYTEAYNQRKVNVKIMEGESKDPEECVEIGKCVISDLPPGRPEGMPILVTFKYNENGIIEVIAKDKETGKTARTQINRTGRMTAEAIKKEKEDLKRLNIS